MLPPSIVVGIENVDRYRDFTFAPDKQEFLAEYPGAGGSGSFISFIQEEVIPLVEKRYATDSTSTLIGQSLGGLLATEILFTYPDTFTNYVIISPSLWWNDQSLLANPKGIADATVPHKVYIGVGNEHEVMKKDALSLAHLLEEQYPDIIKLYYMYFEKQDHANIMHIAVYEAFKILFKDEKE
jgi:predicted alpha/beta superfamily hydrolase